MAIECKYWREKSRGVDSHSPKATCIATIGVLNTLGECNWSKKSATGPSSVDRYSHSERPRIHSYNQSNIGRPYEIDSSVSQATFRL
jgi:hypothetical protein